MAASETSPAQSAATLPVNIQQFELERYMSKYEFSAPYLLCCSDCEPLKQKDLLKLADEECQSMWEELTLSYTDAQGLPALRREVASTYDGVEDDDIIIAVPEEAIFLAMLALLKEGDHVVCTFPGYQSLHEVPRSVGARLSTWEPTVQPDGSLIFNVSSLEALVTPATKLLVVNFPHNPTGALPSLEEWSAVVALCRKNGAYLFSDEMYRGLELDPADRLPSAVEVYERGITLSGVSKVLSLPGLRIGWLACRDASVRAAVQQLKDYTTICSSAPSEVLALIALRAREQLAAHNVATIRSNLQLLEQTFQRIPLLQWLPPKAGSVAFPRITSGEDVGEFCARVVEDCGVLLLPGSVIGECAATKNGHFRVGTGRHNLPQCLEIFEQYLRR